MQVRYQLRHSPVRPAKLYHASVTARSPEFCVRSAVQRRLRFRFPVNDSIILDRMLQRVQIAGAASQTARAASSADPAASGRPGAGSWTSMAGLSPQRRSSA